ncbi:hypothetical protein JCM10296v2_003797 [Rhodotorula toruloides]
MQPAPPGSSTLPRPQTHPAPGSASGDAQTDSGDDSPRKRKKKKNLRACDSCRDKKLRCIYIPDVEPHICFECEKRKLVCEQVRPAKIDPRKRAKLALLEARDVSRASSLTPLSASPSVGPATSRPTRASSLEPLRGATNGLDVLARCVDRVSERLHQEKPSTPDHLITSTPDVRMLGETCVAQLLADLQPSEAKDVVDREFGHSRGEDGSVRALLPSQPQPNVSRPHGYLTSETVLDLVQHFIDHILPLFPVITVEELRALDTLSPVTLMSVCAVAACSRKYPWSLLDTVRAFLKTAIEMSDVFSTSSIANVQANLIMAMTSEVHDATASGGGSMSLIRAGLCVRMAHDLGLHRRPPSDLSAEEKSKRMRLWLGCVIMDKWYAASFGQPQLIDADDCHDYLSEPHDMDRYLVELYKLSELNGRALKAVSRPRLRKTTDAQLHEILADFDAWLARLPDSLQFAGPDSSIQAGVMYSLLVCFESVFLRPFVKQDGDIPAHLQFRPTAARWFAVITRSQFAIDWMLTNGTIAIDCFFPGMYSVMMSCSAQFFSHTKSGSVQNLQCIEAVKNGMHRWALANQDGELSIRQKCYKISTLLWQAAARRHQVVPVGTTPKAEQPAYQTPQAASSPTSGSPAPQSLAAVIGGIAAMPPPHPSQYPTLSLPPMFPPVSVAAFPFGPPGSLSLAGPTLAVPPLTTEGGLPDYLQNEWQGWCENLMGTENWDFMSESWPALPDVPRA